MFYLNFCDLFSVKESILSYDLIKLALFPTILSSDINKGENIFYESNQISEFNVLLNLGLDPSKIIDFSNFRNNNFDWKKGQSYYFKLFAYGTNSVESISELLNTLNPSKLYSVISMIIRGQHIISLSRQLLITNKTNSKEISEFLEVRMEFESMKYDFEIGDIIYFHLSEITLSKSVDLKKFYSIKD